MMAQFAISTTEGRVFGLDLGDWSMLLGGSVLMAGYLVHLRHSERERLRGSTDNAPMIAPSQAQSCIPRSRRHG